jgi:hypothetical protein
VFPGQVKLLFGYLIPVVMFDILEASDSTAYLVNFDEEG